MNDHFPGRYLYNKRLKEIWKFWISILSEMAKKNKVLTVKNSPNFNYIDKQFDW